MKKILMFMALAFMVTACNNQAPAEESEQEENSEQLSMKKEIMVVHDTAMLRMTASKRLMARLKDAWQSSADSLAYQQAYRNLRQANDDMMDWMRNFEMPAGEEVKAEEIDAYLKQEYQAIQAVDENLKKAIQEGEMLVEVEAADSSMENSESHHGHQH